MMPVMPVSEMPYGGGVAFASRQGFSFERTVSGNLASISRVLCEFVGSSWLALLCGLSGFPQIGERMEWRSHRF